jgi:hypothetical protein
MTSKADCLARAIEYQERARSCHQMVDYCRDTAPLPSGVTSWADLEARAQASARFFLFMAIGGCNGAR